MERLRSVYLLLTNKGMEDQRFVFHCMQKGAS